MDAKDIKISDHLYELAIPEALRRKDMDKKELERFVNIFGQKFDLIKLGADKLPLLVDIDQVPDEYLPHFAYFYGYEYNPQRPADTQRKEMKLLIARDRIKGTETAIKQIIKPYDPNVEILQLYPYMRRFSDNANFSGAERYQDGTYISTGVFEIRTSTDISAIRGEIAKQRPAGTRLWYNLRSELIFDNENDWQNRYRANVIDYGNGIYLAVEEERKNLFSGELNEERRGIMSDLPGQHQKYHVRLDITVDGRRRILMSKLYTFEEVLERYPDATVDQAIDILKPVEYHPKFSLQVAYPEGWYNVAEESYNRRTTLQAETPYSISGRNDRITVRIPIQDMAYRFKDAAYRIRQNLGKVTFTPNGIENRYRDGGAKVRVALTAVASVTISGMTHTVRTAMEVRVPEHRVHSRDIRKVYPLGTVEAGYDTGDVEISVGTRESE